MKTIQMTERNEARTNVFKIERAEAGFGSETRIKAAGADYANTISLSLPSQARPLSQSGSIGRNFAGNAVTAFATGGQNSRTTLAIGGVVSLSTGEVSDSMSIKTTRNAGSFANSVFVSGTRRAVVESSVAGSAVRGNQFGSSSFTAHRTGAANVTTKTVTRLADMSEETGGRSLSMTEARRLLTGDIAARSRAA